MPEEWLQKARQVFETELAEARRVAERLDERFSEAVDLLKRTVESRGKIVVVGVGKSGHIGEKLAATLTSTGSPAVVLHAVNALHGDLGVIADGDVLLVLSYSGETAELINLLPAIARFDARIVTLTGNPQSTLARASDVVLDVAVEREACPLNLAPTSSTTAMLMLGDALAMVLLEARGFQREDFARFHPSGSLGRALLLKVKQIMRGRGEIALVGEEATVLDTILAMKANRTGAAVIVGPDGHLRGIFTHGDFARQYAADPHVGIRAVGDVMTENPITIEEDRLAAEVLHILQHHRIDDLVVVDAAGHPVGIVDSQDLARVKAL